MHLRDTGAIYDIRHEAALAALSWARNHGYLRHYYRDPAQGKVKAFSMHQKVWELEYGLPVPNSIDHINGNKLDNRVDNLRAATRSLQALNTRGQCDKRSGLPVGVYFGKRNRTNPYLSSTTYRGRTYNLGSFATPDEAHAAYAHNREILIEYEAALARGESPEMPVILRTDRLRGREVNAEAKDQIAKLADAGMTVREIAAELGLSCPTVRKWLRNAGAPIYKGRRGRPRKKPSPAMDALLKLLDLD